MTDPLFFRAMARQPLAFCLLLPIVWAVFVAVGFTRDDFVEESVSRIWIPTGGLLAQNHEYAETIGVKEFTSTSFAAMAISRDGGNLFREDRLEEIRQRMDDIEALTISYKDETFRWEDVCALSGLGAGTGTTYRFPCARLSPMDLFQETRTYFDDVDRVTWYRGVVQGAAIRPRVLRFGAFQDCLGKQEGQRDVCKLQAGLRTNPDFAEANGYPREYANPLGLIGDVGSLELSDPCRICIEETLEANLDQLQNGLIVPFFQFLTLELRRLEENLTDSDDVAFVDDLATKTDKISKQVDRKSVKDFYYYQVLRGTYSELGAEAYQSAYNQFITPDALPLDCDVIDCPKFNITLDDAKQALLDHADNTFSSVTTAGSPLPAWSESDGTGTMLAGFHPVGGSGIDMSASTLSIVAYLDLLNSRNASAWNPMYTNGFAADPINDPLWIPLVEKNPIYAWWMAAETEMVSHCGNGNLTGANTGDWNLDFLTNFAAVNQLTSHWCTPLNQPFEVDGKATKQHFARMWYDLLLDSDNFLGITQGKDDPYSWTLGAGCGYSLGGERYSYAEQSEADVLSNASRELYFVDEGASVGAIDRNMLIGDATPSVGEYDFSNPLQTVGVIQSLFAGLGEPEAIVNRVKNCNRPGGPTNITEEDAEEVLKLMKFEFDDVWTKGWDDENYGDVQFVSFSDDVGSIGTTGRFLREITLSNGTLTFVSIVVICAFSVFLMASLDAVESKVGLTLVGCGLVVLSYFAALGFSIIVGIKVNVATAWTLPFILLGLGVDDMYIVLLALKKESQKGHSEESFLRGMKEIVVPVSMTSLVNASMFAIMNISDIPAVYLTAQVALIAVCFLYLSIICCFSAYCFYDMKRQEAGNRDVLFCTKASADQSEENSGNKCVGTWLSKILYDKCFRPLVLSSGTTRIVSHLVLWAVAVGLLGVSIWGITQREVGLGLEDFFPSDHQAQHWASKRTESIGSWSIGMNWGAISYGDPETQMLMIKQFEDIVGHPNVAEVDTKQLWIADLAIWTSRMCDANVGRSNPEVGMCGRDRIYPIDNSTCSGTWKRNTVGLRQKNFNDGIGECSSFQGGICRPTSEMHPDDLSDLGADPAEDGVWCPVFEGWSNDKLQFCVQQ